MKTLNKYSFILTSMLVFTFLIISNITAKTSDDSSKTKKMEMKHEMRHNMDMKMNMKSHQMKDTTGIVHEGIIDLKAIDANKDGKVFQDQMHWNVISDTPGKCPLCGMTLKEVTLREAKGNLKKNGYKVK